MTAPAIGRVAPLPEPWSDEDAAAIGRWGHPEATYDALLLTRCLQRVPRLADRTRALGESLYVHGRLPARQRTIAILRTCARVGCAYEWGGQAAFWGPLTGVREADCDALVIGGADDERWSPDEQALIAAVDELEATGSLSEDAWAGVGFLDDEQRMEMIVVCGWYRMICTLCNGLALPVEDWMRPWPRGGDR
ncbi:hypothetical protein [Nocardioides panacisoli]|uniref:Carboxymuconolactone decarboxylase family protein n=1 Tax=Nocardioides panacisoli TaxID=627624 RepID=A0ABP7IB51_9ACTN